MNFRSVLLELRETFGVFCARLLKNDRAFGVILIALFGILASGCGPRSIDGAPLPENYGIYALDRGKTIALTDPTVTHDFSGNVKFIIYDKAVSLVGSSIKVRKIPLEPSDTSADGWNGFFAVIDAKIDEVSKQEGWAPANSIEVSTNAGPVKGSNDMTLIGTSEPLDPGLYYFPPVRFWVDKSRFTDSLRSGIAESVRKRDWQSAVGFAKTGIRIGMRSDEMQDVLAKSLTGLLEDAVAAKSAHNWDKAERLGREALALSPSASDIKNFIANLPDDKNFYEATQAIEQRNWSIGLAKLGQLSRDRVTQPEVISLRRNAEFGRHDEEAKKAFGSGNWSASINHLSVLLPIKNSSTEHWKMWRESHEALFKAKKGGDIDNLDLALDYAWATAYLDKGSAPDAIFENDVINKIAASSRYYGRYFGFLRTLVQIKTSEIKRMWMNPAEDVAVVLGRREIYFLDLQKGVANTTDDVVHYEFSQAHQLSLLKMGDGGTSMFGKSKLWTKHRSEVEVQGFVPESHLVYGFKDSSCLLLDASTGAQTASLPGASEDRIRRMVVSPDGRWLAAEHDGSAKRFFSIWDLKKWKLAERISDVPVVSSMRFTPDSKDFYIADTDGRTQVWSFDEEWSLRKRINISGHAMQFSPDKRFCAFAKFGEIAIWSIEEGRAINVFPCRNTYEFVSDWSAVYVANDREIKVYDPINGTELGEIAAQSYALLPMREGKLAVASTSYGNSKVLIYGKKAPNRVSDSEILTAICPGAQIAKMRFGALVQTLEHQGQLKAISARGADVNPAPEFDRIRLGRFAGMAFYSNEKAPVYCLAEGEVVERIADASDPRFLQSGYAVSVAHPASAERPGYTTVYTHLAEQPSAKIGDFVRPGKNILGYSASAKGAETLPTMVALRLTSGKFEVTAPVVFEVGDRISDDWCGDWIELDRYGRR